MCEYLVRLLLTKGGVTLRTAMHYGMCAGLSALCVYCVQPSFLVFMVMLTSVHRRKVGPESGLESGSFFVTEEEEEVQELRILIVGYILHTCCTC